MLQGRFHELLREVFRSRHPALANILLHAGTQHSDGDCHEFIRLRQLGATRHETLTGSARPGLAKLCMGNRMLMSPMTRCTRAMALTPPEKLGSGRAVDSPGQRWVGAPAAWIPRGSPICTHRGTYAHWRRLF